MNASNVKRVLDGFDTNGSKLVGINDFHKALAMLGCSDYGLTRDEAERLVLRFDANEDGNVSITRVMSFVTGSREFNDDAEASNAEVRRILNKLTSLCQRLVDQRVPVKEVFEHFDRDLSGDVDEREFSEGLSRLFRAFL